MKSTDAIHQTATPHRPQTNAFAERGIRTMLEGARAALLQAGMPHRYWPMAVRHHAFASAISEQTNGDPSPWFLMHGEQFEGWALPFGSLIHFRPPHPREHLDKFAPRAVPGLFLGWHVEPEYGFRGDYIVVALDAFKVPNQKVVNANRVKEIVSFEPTKFPLQAAMMEDMIDVRPIEAEGETMYPDQIANVDQGDDEQPSVLKLDLQYKELFGEEPDPSLTFDQKYEKVAAELFGDLDDGDEWTPDGQEDRGQGEEEEGGRQR